MKFAKYVPSIPAPVTLGLLVICLLGQGCASRQTEFASPETAVQSIVSALRVNDVSALKKILGSQADDVLSSGDAVADKQGRETFLEAYDAKNYLVATNPDDAGSMTLVVGTQEWPLPIPIVKDEKSGQWYFDTDAGKEEIINRRIGANELAVIEVCKSLVDAEREFAARDPNGDGIPEYAQKVVSDPGTRNGLFWPVNEGERESPLGALMALAVDEGYAVSKNKTGEPRPYHGYCYRLLRSQGPNAPGGAMDYMVKGRMIGGFAAVAYPADYGNSGIMSFTVSHRGDVYQKDLGEQSATVAKQMTSFDPDSSWTKVDTTNAPSPTDSSR